MSPSYIYNTWLFDMKYIYQVSLITQLFELIPHGIKIYMPLPTIRGYSVHNTLKFNNYYHIETYLDYYMIPMSRKLCKKSILGF